MRVKSVYKWDLQNDDTLEKCKTAIVKQAFFSPGFGGDIHGNFCLCFVPRMDKNSWIELRLQRLPTGLVCVVMKVKIMCYSNGLNYDIYDGR